MEDHTRAELKKLGKAIRAARLALGASQETFAEMASIDRTWVSRIEQGQVNMSWESISRMARALKVRPSALIVDAGL